MTKSCVKCKSGDYCSKYSHFLIATLLSVLEAPSRLDLKDCEIILAERLKAAEGLARRCNDYIDKTKKGESR